ncbi:MAG: glycosyltransferase [Verrucomicrobiota bacterium]
MSVLPHPCSLVRDDLQTSSQPQESPVFTIVSPGPARWEKGIQLLLPALKLLKTDQFRCRIQWPDQIFDNDGNELTKDEEHSEIISESLSSEQYRELLLSADCIVLPYLREAYFARISGIAVEAMLLGIPIIYTKDTWVADMVSQFGAGLGIPSGDIEALGKSIDTLAEHPDLWKEEAEVKAESARLHFSEEKFQSLLWGID